ncbi:thioredoxin domain-containing protein [Rhodoferax sp.]|uniref:DsbA family protein n=1 Tax=Rhodoferax sp. TaxID=50421 RepID=UPI0025FCE14D|nr:thioredoxin domain-containing protein [Rhodoferax sp.]
MAKVMGLIGGAVAVAVLFVAGMRLHQHQQAAESADALVQNPGSLVKFHSPSTGPSDAEVTIVEFMDPSCKACRAFYPVVKSVLDDNPDTVRLVLRYTAFHPGSDTVVKMLEATKAQSLYWQSLDAVFKSQPLWAVHGNPQVEMVWAFLQPIGVDTEKARTDMQSPTIAAVLVQDMADVVALKVDKTPSFFVNGKPLLEISEQGLRDLVAQEVKASYR